MMNRIEGSAENANLFQPILFVARAPNKAMRRYFVSRGNMKSSLTL